LLLNNCTGAGLRLRHLWPYGVVATGCSYWPGTLAFVSLPAAVTAYQTRSFAALYLAGLLVG
jgi:hypothetical protein